METNRNLPTPEERMAQSQLIELVFKNERTRDTFLTRMAQNKILSAPLAEGGRPTLHKFIASLDNFKRTRGYLTDAQKRELERQLRIHAPFLMTLRVARPATVEASAPVVENTNEDAPLDESDVEALDDERAGMQEA